MRSKRGQQQSGHAMIEFALSFTLIFLVFSGAFQFGYAFCAYNTLQEAVRAGGRYAATRTYNASTCTPSDSFKTAVKNVTVYGSPNPPGGSQPVFAGLTTNNVDVYVPTGACASGVPLRITVAITGFSITSGFVPGFTAFSLNNKPYASFTYEGTYAPI